MTTPIEKFNERATDIIGWPEEFKNWDLVRINTPMDGHCFFHSILRSFHVPYITEEYNGHKIPRNKIITELRKELSLTLDKEKYGGKSHYDLLYDGNIKEYAESVDEFKLENMKNTLNSNKPLGYGFLEYIGNQFNKDIYILNSSQKDIYNTDELKFSIQGDRDSIVLYYSNHHYELVGIKKDDVIVTYFSCAHSFIQFLYDRVQKLIKKDQKSED